LHLILHFHYCLCIWKFLPFNSFCFLQPFPWFRMGYFCLWTVTYVIFQWIVHACINLWYNKPLFLVLTQLLRRRKTHYYTLLSNTSFLSWKQRWPYPFLDLSSSFAPLWYELYSFPIIFWKLVPMPLKNSCLISF
jgi:hypothetical protein